MGTVSFLSFATPDLASHRFRNEIPCQLINEEGVHSAFVDSEPNIWCDTTVFSKHFQGERMKSLMKELKEKYETRIVFDVCDDYLNRNNYSHLYRELIDLADVVTCSSKNLQEKIKEVTGVKAFHCPDPISFPFTEASLPKRKRPRILWFGHGSNLDPLLLWSTKNPKIIVDVFTNVDNVNFFKGCTIRPWSKGLIESIADQYDICLLPARKEAWARSKSHNRAIDAIQSGLFVITDNPYIYGELKDFIFITEDLTEGIEFWKSHPEEVYEMIKNGQKHIHLNYGPERILESWKTPLFT